MKRNYAYYADFDTVAPVARYYYPPQYTKSEAAIALLVFVLFTLMVLVVGESNTDDHPGSSGYERSLPEVP